MTPSHTSAMVVLLVATMAFTCAGAGKKIASIQMNKELKIETESVALEESSSLVEAVADAIVNSTNTNESVLFNAFAPRQRGDNSWDVVPSGLNLPYVSEDANGHLDPETSEYHFTVERYWFDDSEYDGEGFPPDRLVAAVYDTTFNNKSAVATWRLYVAGAMYGEVEAPVDSLSIEFGNGVKTLLNPIESVVYDADLKRLRMSVDDAIRQATPDYADVRSKAMSAVQQDDLASYSRMSWHEDGDVHGVYLENDNGDYMTFFVPTNTSASAVTFAGFNLYTSTEVDKRISSAISGSKPAYEIRPYDDGSGKIKYHLFSATPENKEE